MQEPGGPSTNNGFTQKVPNLWLHPEKYGLFTVFFNFSQNVHRFAPPNRPLPFGSRLFWVWFEWECLSFVLDVVNAEQARIAEEAGACAVMALERVPAGWLTINNVSHVRIFQSHDSSSDTSSRHSHQFGHQLVKTSIQSSTQLFVRTIHEQLIHPPNPSTQFIRKQSTCVTDCVTG